MIECDSLIKDGKKYLHKSSQDTKVSGTGASRIARTRIASFMESTSHKTHLQGDDELDPEDDITVRLIGLQGSQSVHT